MDIKWNGWGEGTTTQDDFSELLGETITEVRGLNVDSEEIIFVTQSGKAIKLYHAQNCCESVYVEDVEGCNSDLVGGLVTLAEEVVGEVKDSDGGDQQYTFYKIETNKGGVWIRWNGESNGYYSTSVDVLGGVVV